jgi:hypothetical protein
MDQELLYKDEVHQIINYLKAMGMEVGLLINFGSKGKLEWKRYVFSKKYETSSRISVFLAAE